MDDKRTRIIYHLCGRYSLNSFKVIAFTHKTLPFELIGKLHVTEEQQATALQDLKSHFGFHELLFLSTCNRIELLVTCEFEITRERVKEIALFLNTRLNNYEAQVLAEAAEIFLGDRAVEHVFRVASSLDSLVVGEREIITQVRKAYDLCCALDLTGDFIRLLVKQTIETAKDIYTNTGIAKNPVSVASLAYRRLRSFGIRNDARVLFVGSGETNTVLANYLQKHKFANFTVFNRTLANAGKLAALLNGRAFALEALSTYSEGFDVLFVCTGSGEALITPAVFEQLRGNDASRKVIIDLALPANVHEAVASDEQVHYVDIASLKEQAEANLQLRRNEIAKCEEIISSRTAQFNELYQERKVEVAFGNVPRQVKAIKELALNEVFAREISLLDQQGKEVLNKVLAYMEKKYNAVAIKTAKEVLLTGNQP